MIFFYQYAGRLQRSVLFMAGMAVVIGASLSIWPCALRSRCQHSRNRSAVWSLPDTVPHWGLGTW
jgi:hypothetical protein